MSRTCTIAATCHNCGRKHRRHGSRVPRWIHCPCGFSIDPTSPSDNRELKYAGRLDWQPANDRHDAAPYRPDYARQVTA